MSMLRRKLRRDLRHLGGQALAVAAMALCGAALFGTLRSMKGWLEASQAAYYAEERFADVFAPAVRVPFPVLAAAARRPGVAEVRGRIVTDALLDLPGRTEPVTARLVSVPDRPGRMLNGVRLQRGRWIAPGARGEAMVSDAFARANGIRPGDSVAVVLGGRWERLAVVATAISPEFLYEIRGAGDVFPDSRRFGVVWVDRRTVEGPAGLDGAVNDVVVRLARGARERGVIAGLDTLLAPYGGAGAYGREDHVSHRFVTDEIAETRVTSVLIPGVFLLVTAFLLHIVLGRVIAIQREQVAMLKAFGIGDLRLTGHYLALALIPVAAGALAGTALGADLAGRLAGVYARFFQFPSTAFIPDPAVLGIGIGVTLGAAALGVLGTLVRVVRLPPAEAMRPEPPPRFRVGALERMGMAARLSLPLRMVLRTLGRRPVRSGLAAFASALAVGLMVAGWYIFDAIDVMAETQFDVIQREDVVVLFTTLEGPDAVRALGREPGVVRAEPSRAVPVRLRHGVREERTALRGLGAGAELRRPIDRRLRPVPLPPTGILLSRTLAERLGVAPGGTVTVEVLEGRRGVREVVVGALVDEPIGLGAYVELAQLARLLGEGPAVTGGFLAVDEGAMPALEARLKRLPAVEGAVSRASAVAGFERTIAESFRISLSVIVLFALVIAIGVVYNGIRVALSERGRELASLRVLGFTVGEVRRLLLEEQAILTLLAVPIGWLVGLGLAALITARVQSDLFRMPLVVLPRTYLLAAVVVITAAAASGLLVARRLGRMDLVAVLKARE